MFTPPGSAHDCPPSSCPSLRAKLWCYKKTGWLQRWSWSNINYNARGLPPTWRYQIICKRSQDGGHAEGRHKLISLSFQLSTLVSVHQLVWSLLYEFSWVCSVGLLILLTMFSPVYWGGEMFHLFLLFCLCHVGLCPPPPKSILSFFKIGCK